MKVRIVSFVVNALQGAWCQGSAYAGGHPLLSILAIIFLVKKNLFPLIVSPDLLVTISGRDFVSLALVTSSQFPSWFFQVSPFPSGFASSLKVCLPVEVTALLWMDPRLCLGVFGPQT